MGSLKEHIESDWFWILMLAIMIPLAYHAGRDEERVGQQRDVCPQEVVHD
jgi:hypothetical protein